MRAMLLLAALPAVAAAQNSHGYFFLAPGGASSSGYTSATVHMGAGGELVFKRASYLGIGAELGALGFTSDWTDSVAGVFSPGVYFHFGQRGRVDPYVTGGYTLMFRSGHANLGHFGGGANWWLRRNLGLKVEFRDHVYSPGPTVHYWQFRFGVVFR